MEIIKILVGKFWNGDISEEERNLLFELLTEHEEILRASDRIDFSSENAYPEEFISPATTAYILSCINAQIDSKDVEVLPAKVVPMISQRKWWWVAASAIVLIVTGTLLLRQPQEEIQQGQTYVASTVRILKVVKATASSKKINLTDGSVITLSQNSMISYYQPFTDSARDITLTGEAMFDVAKEPSKPFTVYANGIATTALGTVFKVNSSNKNRISVTLLEGKVMIKETGRGESLINKPVYLYSGQEFMINKLTAEYLVKAIVSDKAESSNKSLLSVKRQDSENSGQKVFDHEPLALVFKKLSEVYARDIRFDTEDLSGLYFSGTVLISDSILTVLSAICNMNQLVFTEEQGYIQVKKTK